MKTVISRIQVRCTFERTFLSPNNINLLSLANSNNCRCLSWPVPACHACCFRRKSSRITDRFCRLISHYAYTIFSIRWTKRKYNRIHNDHHNNNNMTGSFIPSIVEPKYERRKNKKKNMALNRVSINFLSQIVGMALCVAMSS